MRMIVAMTGALLLAACGSGQKGEKADTVADSAKVDASADKGGAPSNFNYLDACTIMAKDTVAKAMGSEVKSTELADVTPIDHTPAGFSTCNYNLEDGRIVHFLARYNPDGEDIAYEHKNAFDQGKEYGLKLEDAPGIGKAAYYALGLHALNVYGDPHEFMVFSVSKPMGKIAEEDAKASMVALAHAQGY